MSSPTEDFPPSPTGFDLLLKRLGERLADDVSRRKLRKSVSRWCRGLFGVSAFGYALLLLFVMLSFRWIGEKNLSLAFLLYLPRVAFLIPSAFLLLPSVLWARWSALVLTLSSLAFFFIGLGFRSGFAPEPVPSVPGESLTVLTYNRGEHMNQSLQPFKNRTRPDLVVLQESAGRAAGFLAAEGYEEFPHARDLAEFTLLSRFPILSAETVELNQGKPSLPIAVRFTIDFGGREVAIYSVHTVSPRDTLTYYRRGAFLYGIIGLPGTPLAERRRVSQAYWDERIAQARALRDQIDLDPLPVIIAGDFNAPAGGYIHGLFRSRFQDAHARVGHGFGNSFPGTTRNPLSLGGPWMRIDYLFCSSAWHPVWCITEPDRPSQHRAVAAKFELSL